MQFATVFSLVAALAATGLATPTNMPKRDGFYTMSRDANGKPLLEYHGKASTSHRTNSSSSSMLSSRGSYTGVGCDNTGLDPTNTDLAVQGLRDFCDDHADLCHQKTALFSAGNTVAFFCYWRGDAMWDGDSFTNALGMVTDQCAQYQGGSYSDGDEPNRSYSYGYTDWNQQSYCGIAAGTDPGTQS
ncbi:hypothetical protein F4808DRAFT_213588 [Astrocystis sublimbata]|nr:hypothetical protein F4808DRAFT_213588 [Astrocystis sublimbata]